MRRQLRLLSHGGRMPWTYGKVKKTRVNMTGVNMYKTTVKIDGMMCGMCEAHVNDAIRKALPSVKKLSTSHAKGEAGFLTGDRPDPEKLKSVIEQTGYQVLSVETTEYEKKKGLFGIF